MDSELDREALIDALCQPQTYPHPVDVITTIETHISVVFLTGPYAYKLKKPVDFGFLDFTLLSARKHFCEQELRLNRRTAPDLYLKVLPLYLDPQGQVTFDADQCAHQPARAVEYLLQMRQFDPNQVLGRYLNENTVDERQEHQLAEQIAELHLHAQTVSEHSHLGEPETLLQPMLDNFPTLFEFALEDDWQVRLKSLEHWTHQQFSLLRTCLVERKRCGFVRECHGDLHMDNIALIDGSPTLFDGIEFNDEFRWIDVISDLAFLLIDLEFRGKLALKRRILSGYLALTGDYDALELLPFYSVYRTLVRAKITALRLQQVPPDSPEYAHLKQVTFDYIRQAESTAFTRQAPALILMQGVSGCGKSHLANQLLSQVDGVVIHSDVERKRLYGISALTRVKQEQKAELYSAEMSRRTYQRLLELAERILRHGCTVIVDATFLKRNHRTPFWKLAETARANARLLYLDVDPELAEEAIRRRIKLDNNPSDADVEVMRNQCDHLEPPHQDEPALTLDANALRRQFPESALQEFLSRPIHN